MDMNMNISFSKLLQDITMIKPTFNPILDICTIKSIGGYITNLTNLQKWKICPKLIDEIIHMNNTLFTVYDGGSYNEDALFIIFIIC